MAAIITATRMSSLFAPGGDQDGDGLFDPGDIIITQVRISNAGDAPANGITVEDSLNGVTLDSTSIEITPIAHDDSGAAYFITGNTPITISAAQLLGNDVDPDGAGGNAGLFISSVTAGSNGTLVDNGNGTYTFTPTTGLNVNDTASFQYTVTDAQGRTSVTTGIVTFTITDVAWYVDNTYAGGDSDGSYLKPFTSLAPLNNNGADVDAAGETIFVFKNGGDYTAGIALEAGQKLIGDGQAYMANNHNIGGTSRTTGTDTVTDGAVISQASGTILTLSTDNTVKGFTFDAAGGGAIGMADGGGSVTSATAGAKLVIDKVSFTGAGKAVDIDAGGNVEATIQSITSTGSTNVGVQLAGTAASGPSLISGFFNVTSGDISGAASHAFQIGGAGPSSGGTIAVSYGGTIGASVTGSTGGSAVTIADRISGAGTIGFTGNITQTSATATSAGIALSNIADGIITFSGTKTLTPTGGAADAIELSSVSGGAITFSGGAADIDLATGTTGDGISITNLTGGTVNFSSAVDIDMAGTASGRGLNMSGSTGGTVNFTGGLAIETRSGTALHANNAAEGSSLNISGSNSLLSNDGGALVNISNVDTTGMAFTSLNTGAAINGVGVLINNLDGGTFATGSITINGTTAAEGNDGIRIQGGSTTNFSLGTVGVVNTGTNSLTFDADGIEINGAGNGTVTIDSISVQNTSGQGVEIVGATSAVTIAAGSIGNTNDPRLEGVLINGGNANVTVGATLSKTTAGNIVEVTGHTGGAINFSNTISATGNVDNGIKLENNTGGTIAFGGNVTLATGAGTAFAFTNTAATGAAVSLTGGNLNIDTTSGGGILATSNTIGAGSLNIAGGLNSVNVTAGTTNVGVRVDGVTSTGITFEEVHVNGGSGSAVYLKNAGTGGFTITGTGTGAGSGGIVNLAAGGADNQGLQGVGIYLENTDNVSISNMNFTGTHSNYGLQVKNVDDLTVRDSNFTGTFGDNAGPGLHEGTMRFVDLTGIGLFEGNVINGAFNDAFEIVNNGGTLHLTIRDSATKAASFGHNSTAQGNDIIQVSTEGDANLFMNVDGVQFSGWAGDAIQTQALGTSNHEITIKNSDFFNGHTAIGSAGGIGVAIGGTGGGASWSVDYTIDNNNFTGSKGTPIAATFVGFGGVVRGFINNNDVGTAGGGAQSGQSQVGSSAGGGGIAVGFEKGVDAAGLLEYYVNINNNRLHDMFGGVGILVKASNVVQRAGVNIKVEATIANNTISEFGAGVSSFAGIRGIAGGQASDRSTVALAMNNNFIDASGLTDAYGAVMFDQIFGNGSFYFLPGYGGPDFDANAVQAYLEGRGNTLFGPNTSGFAGLNKKVWAADADFTNQNLTQPAPTGTHVTLPSTAMILEPPVTPPSAPVADPQPEPDQTAGPGGGTQDPADPPAPPPADGPAPTPSGNDNVLTEAELATLVEAAIQRWIDAGASESQIAAMRAVDVGLVDMSGVYVGSARPGTISIDSDAAGYGWFVDSTPGEDSEFEGGGTRLTADKGGAADGKVDLLTVLMHELGHQIGLEDDYNANGDDDLMYGYAHVGERRLPDSEDAARATGGPVPNEAFAVIPATIASLPANKVVDVFFKSTINLQEDKYISPLMNTTTIKVGGVTVTTANENNVLDSLTLGNVVYLDANKNGQFDAGEGLANVSVSLYADTNNSGGWDSGDVQLGASQLTLAGGLYSFAGLAPGDYIVVVNASSFNAGQPLNGKVSYAGGADPDNNVDNDDNGIAGIAGLGNGVASQTITLAYNTEPDGTPDVDGDADGDTNLSLDFGFITANTAPTSTHLQGDTVTFTEGLPEVGLDLNFDLTINDATSPNFDGGTLVVRVITNKVATEDQLFFSAAAGVGGPGSGYTASAGNLYYNGVQFATYTPGGVGLDRSFTFNANATPAIVQGLMRGLYYYNTNQANPSTAARTIEYVLKDGDGVDGGLGTDTLTVTSTVNVVGVNDAPDGGLGNADSTNDLTTLTFTTTDFSTGFSDPEGHSFDGIVITSLPSVGTLKLNGTDITAPQAVTVADLTGGALTYVPAAGTGGQSPTFQYKVRDNGGDSNSGVDTDPTASTFTITVTASNVAPTVDMDGTTGGNNASRTFVEGDSDGVTVGNDIVVEDVDDTVIESATVTLTDPLSGETLALSGTLPGSLTSDVQTVSGQVVLTITGPGSKAEYADALELVVFTSTNQNPAGFNLATPTRTIVTKVNDGTSSSNPGATTTITMVNENDAPVTTAASVAMPDSPEDGSPPVQRSATVLFGPAYSDPDSDPIDGIAIVANGSGATGSWQYLDGATWTDVGSVSTASALLVNGSTQMRFVPAADFNGAATTLSAHLIDSSDGSTLTGARVDLTGATGGTTRISTGTVSLTHNVTAVNDAPVLAPSADPIAATEQVAVPILTGKTVADVDLDALNGGSGNYAGAQFSVNRNSMASTDDIFTLVAGPNFTIDGTDLKTTGGQIFATITANNPGLIVISFNSSGAIATSALVDEVIQAVRYTNASNNPPASVVLAYGFNDGSSGGNQGSFALGSNLDVELVTVNIAPVNDAPVNSLGGSIGTGEDAVDAWLSGMSITDPDANPATDELSFVFEVEQGTLEILTNVSGGITAGNIVTQDSNTIVIRATLNQINATLSATNGLTYSPDANYNGADTLTVTTDDRGFTGSDPGLSGTLTSEAHVSTRTISISAQPDAPVAQPDAISTPEDTVGTGDLFANNGSGVDSDVDGDPLSISAVNGSSGNLNTPIPLANGGTVTVQSNGTYSFDPAGKYNTLTNPSGGEVGAVNTSATAGTFQYTLTNGNTVTVTLTVNGVAGPGDWLAGDGTNNVISGTPGGDFFFVVQGGDDDLSGLGGNDIFFFGGAMTSADKVQGGAGVDQIALQGNYSAGLTFGANVLDVENLAILPGNDTRFGDTANSSYDYNLTLLDVNVASGVQMVVDANRLRPGEDFTFNGSAESDGSFFIYGGAGIDNLTGGGKNDVFLFGAPGKWGSSDVLVGGGGIDQLALRGDYTVTFGAAQLVGIEQIAVLSAFDTRFGDLGDTYDYNLTLIDANVVGIQMTVDAASLRSNETLTFNGSAEDDGSFRVFGGQGKDVIHGSQNADIIVGRGRGDTLYGNGGNDVFRYDNISESNSVERDGIQDFSLGDLIDLSRIDANTLVDGDQAFTFMGEGDLSGAAGELRFKNISSGGTVWEIKGDTDGNGISDFEVVVIINTPDPITSSDFIL